MGKLLNYSEKWATIQAEEGQKKREEEEDPFCLIRQPAVFEQLLSREGGEIYLLKQEIWEVPSLNSERGFVNSSDIFVGGIDPNFKKLDLDLTMRRFTPGVKAEVSVLIQDECFSKIFGSLSRNLDSLCWTQCQIVEIAKVFVHKEGGFEHFLLFTKLDNPVKRDASNLFVAKIYFKNGLRADLFKFTDPIVWLAEYWYQMITPQW